MLPVGGWEDEHGLDASGRRWVAGCGSGCQLSNPDCGNGRLDPDEACDADISRYCGAWSVECSRCTDTCELEAIAPPVEPRPLELVGTCETTYPTAATLADVTGDGRADLVCVITELQTSLKIYRSDGAGGFAVPTIQPIDTMEYVLYMTLAGRDLDADGRVDLLFNDRVLQNVSIGEELTFAAAIELPPHVLAELNGDLLPDLVTVTDVGGIDVRLNSSDAAGIAFGAAMAVVTPMRVGRVWFADFNADGLDDAVIAASVAGHLRLDVLATSWSGDTVSFELGPNLRDGIEHGRWYETYFGDLDDDGRADVTVLDTGYQVDAQIREGTAIQHYLNASTGSVPAFTLGGTYVHEPSHYFRGLDDIDGDARLDIWFQLNSMGHEPCVGYVDASDGRQVPLTGVSCAGTIITAPGDIDGDGAFELLQLRHNGSDQSVEVFRLR